ncbi:hypothetical protein SAMN02745823_02086 [Sporobacter termitidis DSM 10068]|uniref:Uncharacterized protein n=1 Tax=Sporobacter termitidis DSM 10068 TaxID=1123282 RepID=A0A1M5XWQ2_9FIRM|nr:hypothetical protein [Sporobacter termitidis]SHI03958.1 hypothetical protein SAMN02745823_02086 [Sporobacter termitidis DSM 10068]
MAQYTFSFLRSEYDRIPIQLKKELATLVEKSNADDETRQLLNALCKSVEKAVADLSKYAQDQLRIW